MYCLSCGYQWKWLLFKICYIYVEKLLYTNSWFKCFFSIILMTQSIQVLFKFILKPFFIGQQMFIYYQLVTTHMLQVINSYSYPIFNWQPSTESLSWLTQIQVATFLWLVFQLVEMRVFALTSWATVWDVFYRRERCNKFLVYDLKTAVGGTWKEL